MVGAAPGSTISLSGALLVFVCGIVTVFSAAAVPARRRRLDFLPEIKKMGVSTGCGLTVLC